MSRKHVSRASKEFNKEGLTRREFMLERALPTLTAVSMSPVIDAMIRHSNAMAEGVPTSSWIALMHVHLSGGWGFNGTFVGKTTSGSILDREAMRQHGITTNMADPTGSLVTLDGGGQMYPETHSSFTRGLNSTASADARRGLRLVVYHAESPDDNTSDNPSGISPLLTLAGMGGLLASAAGTTNSESGNGTLALASNPAAARLTVGTTGDIINMLAFSKVLSNYGTPMYERLARGINDLSTERIARISGQNRDVLRNASEAAAQDFLQKVTPAQTPDLLNPSKDPLVASAYGLSDTATNTFTSGGNASNAKNIQATIVKSALDGNMGPGAFQFGGYDYHQNAQGDIDGSTNGTTNRANFLAGETVGRMIQAAHNKQKPIAVWISTDGGLQANLNHNFTDLNSAQYQGDRGRYSGAALFIYFPTQVSGGTVTTSAPTQRVTNVGAVDGPSGMVLTGQVTGNLRMATAHAFYNMALLSGNGQAALSALALAAYTRNEIDALVAMPSLFIV